MTVVVLVSAAVSAIILLLHIALAAGVLMNFARERRMRAGGETVCALRPEVIVSVRNEERTLPALLDALRAQNAPDCLFLFVDDRSSDATPRLLDGFCAEQGERARVIYNREEPVGLTGKQAALDLGFFHARGDVLLFTDGDCVLPPLWVKEMLGHFQDPRVGVVLGRIELPQGRTFLQRFQAFEQPLINQYNFGSAGIGLPTGCFGNNMAIRTRAVVETGGFKSLGYSVTEDALLLDAVSRTGKWKVRACTSQQSAVITRAMQSWKEYVDQHTRWNAGALFSPDLVSRLLYIFVVLIYLVGSLLIVPLSVIDWRVILITLNSYLSIGLLAFLNGVYPGKRHARYFLLFLPYLLFFEFFYSFITLRAFFRRPFTWKGASLRA
jgi:cellulose synthase/poly-beta-1,6-N-acetylglucosamine synthase-like glycosyltransferase